METSVRDRFRSMLDEVQDGVRIQKSERSEFQARCRRAFSPLWNAIDAIKDEISSRDLGKITLANPTPSSDRFEIIYDFQAKGFAAVLICFRFNTRTGPSQVDITIGTNWSNKATTFQ